MGNDHSQNNDKNHQKRQSSEKNFYLSNPDVVAEFNELKKGCKESVNLLEFEVFTVNYTYFNQILPTFTEEGRQKT